MWQLPKANQVSAVVSLVCVWRQLSIIASLCLLRRQSWWRLWFSLYWQGGCSCSESAKVVCSTSACGVFVFTYRGVIGDTCLLWSVSEMMLWRIRIYFGLYLSLYNGEHIFISVCTRSDVIENTYLFWSLPVEMLRYVMGNSCYFGLYPSWYNGEYVLILVFACRDIMGNMSLFWSLPAVMWLGTCLYFGLYTYRNVMGNVYLYWLLAVVM